MKKYLFAVPACAAFCVQAQTDLPTSNREPSPASDNGAALKTSNDFWRDEIGNGFRKGAHEVGLSGGYAIGGKFFGTSTTHNLVLGDLHAGWMISDIVAENTWLRGNWELMATLLGGEQINTRNAKLAAFDPAIRYNFATGTRFVPFLEGGVGVMYTDIRKPDLGSDFQFNEYGGIGTHFFFNRHVALTLEARYMHISNAGIHSPNRGVNVFPALIGLNYFF